MKVVVCAVLFCVLSVKSDGNESIQSEKSKKNYTANDLILGLTKLANENILGRLRFPADDFEDQSQQNYNLKFPIDYQNQNYNQDVNNNQNPNFNYNQDIVNNQIPLGAQQPFPGVDFSQYPVIPQQFLNPNLVNYYRPQRKRRPRKQRPYQFNTQYPGYPNQQNQYFQGDQPYFQRPYRPNFPGNSGSLLQGEYPSQNFDQPNRYPPFYQGNPGNIQGDYPGSDYPGNFQGDYPQFPNQGDPLQPGFGQGGPFGQPGDEGPFSSLTKALGSIAKYDDKQCVPRLLCEVAAGGNPSAKQSSFIPSFLNMESLFTLLSALTGSVNPLLVFGRAALLGVSSQGSPTSCRYAYPNCPRDPDRLVEYLNNHNGGFFRFFNGLQDPNDPNQPQIQQGDDQSNLQNLGINQNLQNLGINPGNFGLNQLNQLFGQLGQQQYPQNRPFNYNRRPSYYNQFNSFGNNYPPQYPYNSFRSNTINNTDLNTDETQERIQNKKISALNYDQNQYVRLPESNDLYFAQNYNQVHYGGLQNQNNLVQTDGSFKFPENNVNQNGNSNNFIRDDRFSQSNLQFSSGSQQFQQDNSRGPKYLVFPERPGDRQYVEQLYFPKPLPYYDHSKMIFPDRTGTGNLKFDSQLSQSYYRPEVFRNDLPNYSNNGYRDNPYRNPYTSQYTSPSKKKRLVYVVRGNGDPNHPEVLEENYGRNLKTDDLVIALENDEVKNASWSFPSSYQGIVYNDRPSDVKVE